MILKSEDQITVETKVQQMGELDRVCSFVCLLLFFMVFEIESHVAVYLRVTLNF